MMRFECRSALYMPASNARAMAKGPSLAVDAIVVDLEDSVAPDAKIVAREQASQTLLSQDYGYRLRVLRINAGDTDWHADDVEAAAQCKPDAVLLPKVEHETDIALLSAAMDEHPALVNTSIWAMMESPLAVINANIIAASSKEHARLQAFLIGNNDMALEANMRVQSDRTHLLPWIMTLVAAAKANRLGILDGVYNDFDDLEGFALECKEATDMGMDGKSLIHPKQLSICNDAFSPSAQDIAHAESVVRAFSLPENTDKGAISIDGKMLERLHLSMAESLLERARRLALRS